MILLKWLSNSVSVDPFSALETDDFAPVRKHFRQVISEQRKPKSDSSDLEAMIEEKKYSGRDDVRDGEEVDSEEQLWYHAASDWTCFAMVHELLK